MAECSENNIIVDTSYHLFYCDECRDWLKESQTKVNFVEETIKVKGQPINIHTNVRVCCKCGNDVADSELDNETLSKVYEIYCQRNNLVTKSEINDFVNHYGMNSYTFGILFHIQKPTRYLNGAIPSEDRSYVIRKAIENPDILEFNLKLHVTAIPSDQYNHILRIIERERYERNASEN